jgi:class 3 adenylate cyclase
MSDLRALLLTDVVDSTKLSLQVGDAEMARLWAAHDRSARDLLPVWHGREIDKTDGMLLLFDAASDAVGYALAYQQALSQLVPPLKARAGLHVGAVTLRENSPADVALGAKSIEVEGVAKATAARVMSVAMGGQILLSAEPV